ncbi:MAG: response regulator [Acidobacteriaceae bacterium]
MRTVTRPRVLVADDERVIAETLTIILRKSGFDAASAFDGEEAVAKARSWKPDPFLSDVMMPRLGGIEAARQIRAELSSCRVLLFSGMAATSDLLSEAGAQGHDFEVLAKPVQPEALLERLEVLM